MPELRKNPLLGHWVAVASERVARLDQFALARTAHSSGPCRYCPGRERELPPAIVTLPDAASTDDWGLRVVPSKFPLLRVEGDIGRRIRGVYDVMHGVGAHEIIIPTPLHGVDFGDLPVAIVERAIGTWIDRMTDLQRDTRFRSFIVTHGRGRPDAPAHAHTQLLATPIVPHAFHAQWLQARAYHDYRDRCLFCDLLEQELEDASRVLIEGEHLVAFCPFAGAHPFEMWIFPRRHAAHLASITRSERAELAHVVQSLCRQLDAVLGAPPYTLTVYQAPTGEDANPACHWHIEIVPHLSGRALVTLDESLPLNPVAPEDAARFLRAPR